MTTCRTNGTPCPSGRVGAMWVWGMTGVTTTAAHSC